MNRLFETLRELATNVPFRIGAMVLVAMTFFVAFNVRSVTTLPPVVTLSPDPLYSKGLRAKPTMTLALSVEFPTVGAQYLGSPGAAEDATYSTATQYVGYFDSESCYTYNNNSNYALRRYDRTGAAASHDCAGAGFSGNFMNWATSSAIDVLRLGLTGGDRAVDTTTLTILQRAVLPNTSVSTEFWNRPNFPSKRLLAALVAGAVPAALKGNYTGDVYVANCFNRVHFGTAATGSCDSPGNNSNLGASSPSTMAGPITNYLGVLPSGFSTTACAAENSTCSFSGIRQVAYGVGALWKFVTAKDGIVCGNALGDPAPGFVKACYVRSDPTGWVQSTTAGALTADDYFYTRVSVCDVDSTGALLDPRTNFCRKYPSGGYKPIGNLQRYSDNIRVSAFGYLTDSTPDPNQRYGGVLRAAMKYVGAKSFDQNFVQSTTTNAQQEWDITTGVFIQNPDVGTTGLTPVNSGNDSNWPGLPISGVTNYLNQFGRTGPVLGQYKTYDPVGELYYESLRYIQGLPPTAAATSGMTAAMQDGYPVYTSWVDPHPAVAGLGRQGYKCVKNNILVIGDVNTWYDKSFPGNPSARATNGDTARAVNNANNEPDFYYWTQVVGSFEANTGLGYVDGLGVSRSATNFNPANSSLSSLADLDTGARGAAYYLAGAAYWANTHDIRGTNWTSQPTLQRPGMRASTYMLDVNENGTDSTYTTRAQTQFFLTAKYGGFSDATLTGNPYLAYGNGNAIVNSNANWSKPSLTGGTQLDPQNYYLSSSASAVLSALDNIFASIAKGANSIAGAAISTQTLTSANTGYIYQARFDPTNYWAGDVIPFKILINGTTVSIAAEGDAPWRAAAVLDARDLTLSPRNIFIGSSALTPTTTAMSFNWSSLDATTQALIKLPGDTDAVGALRVNFLRGDRTGEGTTFRQRGSRFGDIVNSGIAYSGPPTASISDAGYAAFASTNATRPTTLFVGANDGMLHAFDATNGNETFAYIPSWVASKVNQLTTSAYVHQPYVDATPVVGEAYVGTAGSGSWKTVLVGGSGGGGQGVYAIDVTNASAATMSASKLLWEFTDKHDASLGNVTGKPQILKFRTNALSSGTAVYKWFAVFGSGVNNYSADGSASTTGYPALFVLDLAKPAGTAWTQNTNYWKIELPRADSATAQGVMGFSALTGNSGEVSYIYTGDLQGNLWKLDFTQLGTSSWTADALSYYVDTSNKAVPMYTAMDANGKVQSITMDPALVYGRNKSIIVAFGTGKYLETTDVAGGYTNQSFYALYDNATKALDNASDAIAGRGRLSQVSYAGGVVAGSSFIWGRPTSDTDLTKRAGWYFDLPSSTSGERQISDFDVISGKLFAGSIIPAASSCDDGSGNAYVIDVFSGGGSYTSGNVGLLGQPFVIQIPGSYDNNKDSAGTQNGSTINLTVLASSGGLTAGGSTVTPVRAGRLSWRQLNNNK